MGQKPSLPFATSRIDHRRLQITIVSWAFVGAIASWSTMYWIGLLPGDIHCNVSSPGWAKHAWSSCFAPWNAEATVFVPNQSRFNAKGLLDAITRASVTTFCAPPTVWRMLVTERLVDYKIKLREVVSAGSGVVPSREIALSIFQHIRKALAPFNRIRRIEFSDLPKTISGKIRRVELRDREAENVRCGARPEFEFREGDFPDLGC